MSETIKHGGNVKLGPMAPQTPTTPGDPPPPPSISASYARIIPTVNGVPQTQQPHPPIDYTWR